MNIKIDTHYSHFTFPESHIIYFAPYAVSKIKR